MVRNAVQTAEIEAKDLDLAKLLIEEELHANTSTLAHITKNEPLQSQGSESNLGSLHSMISRIGREISGLRAVMDQEQSHMSKELATLGDELRKEEMDCRLAQQEARMLRSHLAEMHTAQAHLQNRNSELQAQARKLASRASSMNVDLAGADDA